MKPSLSQFRLSELTRNLSLPLLAFFLVFVAVPTKAETLLNPISTFELQMERLALSEWEGKKELHRPTSSKAVQLDLKEAVQRVIESNVTVQNAKLEYIKADSSEAYNESAFLWKLTGGVTTFKQFAPFNANNIFAGTKISNDRISAGIERQFRTGTYFKSEISTLRFDSNAFEGQNTPPQFSTFAIPPLFTGGINVMLSQELMKYSFGKNETNKVKIIRTQTKIERENLIQLLTQIVVKVLVDYWSLGIQDSMVDTYSKLLDSTKDIRNLTQKKRGLGLAEEFEVNQWNGIIAKTESSLTMAKTERREKERDLIRILGVDPTTSISGVTDLVTKAPESLSLEEDLKIAFENRVDLQNILKQKQIAKLTLENSELEDEASIQATVNYTTAGQNITSPQRNFLQMQDSVWSFNFPQNSVQLKMSYPLWDKGVKASIRDSKIEIELLEKEEAQLRTEIRDELSLRRETIQTSYQSLQEITETNKQFQKYYNGLLVRFKQGRYNQVDLKRALDGLVQSELTLTQAKINYNINLIRYELVKNTVFQKYGIDIYKIIDEVQAKIQQQGS